MYVRLVDRKDRTRSVDELTVPLRERLARMPGITVTNIGVLDLGGGKSIQFSVQGSDLGELERLAAQLIMARLRDIPGLVDLDSTLKPDKPTLAVDVKRDAAADLGLNVGAIAGTLRTLLAGVSVGNWRAADGENYDVKRAAGTGAARGRPTCEQLPPGAGQQRRRQRARGAAVAGGRGGAVHRRQPDQPPRPEPRESRSTPTPWAAQLGEVSADIRTVLDDIAWPPGYRYSFGGSTKNMQESFTYAVSARWRWRWSSST